MIKENKYVFYLLFLDSQNKKSKFVIEDCGEVKSVVPQAWRFVFIQKNWAASEEMNFE